MTGPLQSNLDDTPPAPPTIPGIARARVSRREASPALRHRMRRQAQLMFLVVFLVLTTALSVPFLLHYLNIRLP